VPKRTIDELLDAIETVQILKEAVRRHETALERVLDRIDARLDAIEAHSGRHPA
jgi:hypothetical protein